MIEKQSGFTFIELVVVIILIGILSVTAVPKFIDLSDEAGSAAISNIAGTIESASALNHAVDIAQEAGLTTTDVPQTVNACTLANVNVLLSNPLNATDYTVTGAATIADKGTEICTIAGPTGDSANFALIGAVPT
jgi:MSHA pilin protein MshA